MQPIFPAQKLQRPMYVAGLFSGGASSIRYMLNDPNHGKLYQFVVAATHNPEASGIEHLKPHMPVVRFQEPEEYFAEHGLDPKNQYSKYGYWGYVLDLIEGRFDPDFVVLSGLMKILRYPFVRETDKNGREWGSGLYDNHVFNVHPADLAVLSGQYVKRINAGDMKTKDVATLRAADNLQRKFKGADAVRDALLANEILLRSSIHIATRNVDEGSIIVRSPPVIADVGPEKAPELQEWMKWNCDGPAFVKAMELVASGRIAVDDSTVFMLQEDKVWRELPYGGYSMEGVLTSSI